MSEPKDVVKLAENELGEVAGGMTRNYLAALDVMAGKYGTQVARDVIAGKYGNNQDRINALSARGYDAGLVQDIVNGMLLG